VAARKYHADAVPAMLTDSLVLSQRAEKREDAWVVGDGWSDDERRERR
jgi:hypothetical protein